MGFEEILGRRLGAMKSILEGRKPLDAPSFDPEGLYYRRAVGLEARIHPDESWSSAELMAPGGKWQTLDIDDASNVIGLTRWQTPADLGVKAASLWRWVERDLLYFSETDPGAALTGTSRVLEGSRDSKKIALRRSMWPTVAIEDAVQIAPMPFMPRGRDLFGASFVGLRLASRERGHEVFGVSIVGSEKTGRCLRELLPLLDGTRTASEIVAMSPDAHNAERMLRLLDRVTALEEPPPALVELRGALAQPEHPQVTWLGHAGVLIQAGGTNVLVDPVFFSASEPPERFRSADGFDARALPEIHAVFITHGDNDHLNANSLARLPRETPIFVPWLPDPPPPHQVDIRGVLRLLGFQDVREVEDWQELRLGAFSVTCCPFHGEDWGLELAQQTYLFESSDLSVFCSADAHRMDDVYGWLGERPRRVDLAMMGVSGSAESYASPSDLGYGNFYRDFVPRVRHNQWVEHCASPKIAAESLAQFSPVRAFGYAAGGASFIELSHGDVGDHEMLAEEIQRLELSTEPLSMPLGRPVSLGVEGAE